MKTIPSPTANITTLRRANGANLLRKSAKTRQTFRTLTAAAAFMISSGVSIRGATWPTAQQPLPTKAGMSFVVESFNGKVTANDKGTNHFGGNMGTVDTPAGVTSYTIAADANGGRGGCGKIAVNFANAGNNGLGGLFMSLNGLTDTLVSFDGSTPTGNTSFPGYFADFDNFFRDFLPWQGRTIDQVTFQARRSAGSAALTVKVELQDESGHDVFRRVLISDFAWKTITVTRSQFDHSVTGSAAAFNWNSVAKLNFLVEKFVSGEVSNSSGAFEIDEVRLEDVNGSYPDLAAAKAGDGTLKPEHQAAFLEYVRRLSYLFFTDFVSTDSRTGGIILDRSSFADLLTVGGIGFQISAYVTGVEQGYLTRQQAVSRVLVLLSVLADKPQGPAKVGCIGYKGFFYHFLNPDGLRKMNFDRPETLSENEALNTVELSLIDTALACVGATVARAYFAGSSADEGTIRTKAATILGRVEWPFMAKSVNVVEGGAPKTKVEFCLGWKPNETRDDTSGDYGRFLIPDADGLGSYASKSESGVEKFATLDYHTTEAQIAALLAMSSPVVANRLDAGIWNGTIRDGTTFVKSYDGPLFTYTWLELWVATQGLGPDNHPERPTDWFANTAAAITAIRQHGGTNPNNIASLASGFTGLEPCEGPFDLYFANRFPGTGIAETPAKTIALEWEDATPSGTVIRRGNASEQATRYVTSAPSALSLALSIPAAGNLRAIVRYSNDGPADNLTLDLDGMALGSFQTVSTGSGGDGWNNFASSGPLGPVVAPAGAHQLNLTITATDQYGVEADAVTVFGNTETGTLTPYGAAEQMSHAPDAAVAELWKLAWFDLNGDGRPPLLHPRLGMADAFQIEVADALLPSLVAESGAGLVRSSGPWSNQVGFAIDHGPLFLSLSNRLDDGFIPSLFMGDPLVSAALMQIFPQAALNQVTVIAQSSAGGGGTASGGGSFVTGARVTVTAQADVGKMFVNWTDGATIASTSAIFTFVANSSRTLTANFAPASPAFIVIEQPTGFPLQSGAGSVGFGTLDLGSNAQRTFVIRNTGGLALNLGTLTIDGANLGDFSLNPGPGSPIPSQGSATFVVKFAPAASGSRSAALHIPSDDTLHSPFDIMLSGAGSSGTAARKAQLTTPANGSALPSTTLPLAWDAGHGVTSYYLFVGTYAGGADILAENEGGAQSRTVTVPAGRSIYVTLWSLIGGAYQANYYFFNAAVISNAALTSPANGSNLSGGQLNLQWAAGSGASAYAVWLGSYDGGYDLGAANAGSSTAWNFTGLPQDGGPVYVTLWSLVNGGWRAEHYWFTTALPVSGNRPSRLLSPANTTSLTAAMVNLTWDAGTGVTSRALWVGSGPNGYDLYADMETGLTRSVAVPADGRRIYVSLWSFISGAWQSDCYWFTAPTLLDGGAAQIVSPASGGTLADGNLALIWSDAAGASQYALWIGTVPGGYDLLASSEGTNLSRTVAGLPVDGRPVYVTLYSLMGGAWKSSSAWFATANTVAGNKRALVTSPANGATLASAAQTFTWNGGTGVTACALWIGSSAGGYDIWSSLESPASSRTVTLPADGRRLHVTLWSFLNGAWQNAAWYFVATSSGGSAKAVMTSPAAGSTFAATSQSFAWSPGTGPTAYALWIGRTPGGYDVYAGYEGSGTSRTVTTLPSDGGPVYVTLWSYIAGAWQSNDYIYNARVP